MVRLATPILIVFPPWLCRPKRPDSVDLAAQLLLGHSGDKPLNGDLSYDEDALHRAQELIQAAEMDRKSTGGGGVIGP